MATLDLGLAFRHPHGVPGFVMDDLHMPVMDLLGLRNSLDLMLDDIPAFSDPESVLPVDNGGPMDMTPLVPISLPAM